MKMGSKWRLVAIATLALAALTLVACGGDDDDDENGDEPAVEVEQFPANTTMGKIQEAGEIRIGVKYDVPPFGFNNPQTGEVEGFDVDLGTYIAERLGVEPVFREATTDNRIPLLVDGTIDLRLIDRYSECLELIQTDAVDAISTDDVILTGMVVEDDTLDILGIEYTTEPYGAGIPEGDTEFKQFVDDSIAAFIDDGTWQERYDEWVGQYIPEEQQQGPPDVTLKEALKLFPLE